MKAAALLAITVLAAAAAPARAQIADALGQPLPAADLDPGTITVRVIAGSPRNPVTGSDVTLSVDGTPREARTDDAGRATFKGLPVGATVQASVAGDDQKPVTSAEFQVPASGGARLLLTTKPFEPDAAGGAPFAPFAGGGGGMPEPRVISGQARPEQADAPGTITVRLTYDDLADKSPPVGVPVLLAAYHGGNAKAPLPVDVQRVLTDKDGRATFAALDITGETSYIAIAELPRGNGVDRLMSLPCVLDARAGMRLVLSAAKRDSTDPPIDDLAKFTPQRLAPDAGKLHVQLVGWPVPMATIRVVAHAPGGKRRVLAQQPATRAAPDIADVQMESEADANAQVPARSVHAIVHGGAGQQANEPLPGVSIALVPAKQRAGDPAPAATPVKTSESGEVDVTTSIDGPVVAVITVNGTELHSRPFDVSKQGAVLYVIATWEKEGKLVADVDLSAVAPDEVVFAEAEIPGAGATLFRSPPVVPIAGKGSVAQVVIAPPIQYTFSLTSHVDDELLAVQGTFQVLNNTLAPYVGGPDGMVLPLPAHFRGAQIAERDQSKVAVAEDRGFRIGRPIPPGGISFVGAFSLPIEGGAVHWALDLPIGTFHSGMEILETAGMTVDTPRGANGEVVTGKDGKPYYVLPEITIAPQHSMQMTIHNLPSRPAWRVWGPRVAGILGVLVMMGGLALALGRTSRSRAEAKVRALRREQLLDELTALEPGGPGSKTDKRRAQITEELEALWDE